MRVRAGIALVLGLTASGAAAQGGYTKEKYPDLGIELERPRDYEQIPTQPDEEFVVLYFAEKLPKDPRDRPPIRTELWVLAIDYVGGVLVNIACTEWSRAMIRDGIYKKDPPAGDFRMDCP